MSRKLIEASRFLIVVLLIVSRISRSSCISSTYERENRRGSNNEPSRSEYADDNLNLVDEDNENQLEDSNRFNWDQHQDDHSIYSHVSLMSNNNMSSEEDEDSDLPSGNDKNGLNHESPGYVKPLSTSNGYVEAEWQLMFRTFDSINDTLNAYISSASGKQTNVFEDIVSRLKPECKRSIYHIEKSLRKHKLWAMKFIDAFGKLPSGVAYGKFSSPGDYEECLSINVDEKIAKKRVGVADEIGLEHHKFRGKYCFTDTRLPLPPRPKGKVLDIYHPVLDLDKTEFGRLFPEMKNYSGYASAMYEIGLTHGICIPSTCEIKDITNSMTKTFEGLYLNISSQSECEQRFDEPQPWRTSQIISILLLSVSFVNCILASIIYWLARSRRRKLRVDENSKRGSNEGKIYRDASRETMKTKLDYWLSKSTFYINCFSIQSNFERLTKPDPIGLDSIHYTRVVSMGLTIVTHTAAMGTLLAVTKPGDMTNSEKIMRDFIPQMLANAFSSIQIFFFMAGMMLTISTYPNLKRNNGRISFVEYSVKRATRMLPGMVAAMCVNFIWPLLVDSPASDFAYKAVVEPCEYNWWRTLGFLSNFDHIEKTCLRHSYFSSSDYQLHILAFPLLVLLYKNPKLSMSIAGFFTLAGLVAQTTVVLTKNVIPFMVLDYVDKDVALNVIHYYHHPLWNHMTSFFYGFIVGYVIARKKRLRASKMVINLISMIVLPLGFCAMFAPYYWNHYKRPITKLHILLYAIFDKFLLLSSCAWLSYMGMVLAIPEKKETHATQQNLPNIVAIGQRKNKESPLPERPEQEQDRSPLDGLTLSPPIAHLSLARQRSSPNLTGLVDEISPISTIRPSMSSINIGAIENTVEQFVQSTADPKEDANQLDARPKAKRPPVASMNTLFLMLSRLTFQLYLFNMVFLWIDVNHSKYIWYFSYYFILTKSLGVYVITFIFSLVFFITMESPCITIFYWWVKTRAKRSQAKRDARIKSKSDFSNDQTQSQYVADSDGAAISSMRSTGKLSSLHGISLRLRPQSSDFPNIVSGGGNNPSFSYIDTSPSSTSQCLASAGHNLMSQTRM